jgi:hypothetical protein
MDTKTLKGKDGYLFLINDSSNEIIKHCKSSLKGNINIMNLYNNIDNYILLVYPDKSYFYNMFLPDEYKAMFRPIFDDYKQILKNKILDPYDELKKESNIFYKTDTHINLKGNYIVYNFFVGEIKKLLNIDFKLLSIESLKVTNVNKLSSLQRGIGDLTWISNLGDQILSDTSDIYYDDEIDEIKYMRTYIDAKSNIKLLNFINNTLVDETDNNYNKMFNWNMISNYIIYRKNNYDINNNLRVIVFYDSFLAHAIHLYLNLFKEIFLIKTIFNQKYIDVIKPDFIFEFRAERFLL